MPVGPKSKNVIERSKRVKEAVNKAKTNEKQHAEKNHPLGDEAVPELVSLLFLLLLLLLLLFIIVITINFIIIRIIIIIRGECPKIHMLRKIVIFFSINCNRSTLFVLMQILIISLSIRTIRF